MDKPKLLERISIDPEIGHGKPTVRRTRYPVETIPEYLSGGNSIDDILAEFPDLERGDILACISYATEALKYEGLTHSEA